jgi:hypothetical protein
MGRASQVTLHSQRMFLYEMDAIELSEQIEKKTPAINAVTREKWLRYLDKQFRWHSDYVGCVGSLPEARALLKEGWPKGARRLKALAERLAAEIPPAKSIRRRLRWSDDGDEVSKDRLNGGFVDFCWRASKRELVASPEVVTVETNWGGTARRSAEELFWQGAAAACLTDILEQAGYRVELYANNYSVHPIGRTLLRIRVKEADAPVRIDTLAAVLCHAAVFRVFGLAAKEQAPFYVNGGHGKTTEITRERFSELEEKLGQDGRGTIMIGAIYDEQSALQAIEAEIARLQGESR